MGRNFFGVIILLASAVLLWRVFFTTTEQPEAVDVTAVAPLELGPAYQVRDWSEGTESSLNISLYTFRDDNHSGRYDVGDLPMAGVVVDLVKPDGRLAQVKSNINGYANFKMSASDPQQPVTQADQVYQFKVRVPPGWAISAGELVQEITFRTLPGSVAGLVAEKAPDWVGLVPALSVAGRLMMASGEALPQDLQITLEDAQGQSRDVALGDDGQWQAPVSPGRWVLKVGSAALQWALQREIPVTIAPVELMDIAVGAELPPPLPALVVQGFDWLQRSNIDKVPNGQLGLEWDYLLAVDNQTYGGPGYVNGLVSGHAVAYNSSGHPVTIAAPPGQVFDFVGGFFSVAWPAAHGEILDIVAWRDGVEVARHALTLSYLGPAWLDAELRGIDKLSLSSRHYWQFVVDDLKFRLASQPQ